MITEEPPIADFIPPTPPSDPTNPLPPNTPPPPEPTKRFHRSLVIPALILVLLPFVIVGVYQSTRPSNFAKQPTANPLRTSPPEPPTKITPEEINLPKKDMMIEEIDVLPLSPTPAVEVDTTTVIVAP